MQTHDVETLLGQILTEPLTVAEAAGWFDVSRDTMRGVLNHMAGVERFGKRKVRIPALAMPPKYLLDRGLLRPLHFDPAEIDDYRRK
jgi:hypothetical protein